MARLSLLQCKNRFSLSRLSGCFPGAPVGYTDTKHKRRQTSIFSNSYGSHLQNRPILSILFPCALDTLPLKCK